MPPQALKWVIHPPPTPQSLHWNKELKQTGLSQQISALIPLKCLKESISPSWGSYVTMRVSPSQGRAKTRN